MEKGTKDLKEALNFVGSLSINLTLALRDGRINVRDLGRFLAVLPTIGPAFEGSKNITNELNDLEEWEQKELATWFATEFGCENDRAEILVEKGTALFLDMLTFVNLLKASKRP